MHSSDFAVLAKTRNKFVVAAAGGVSTIYRREAGYPNGKAALIEVTSAMAAPRQVEQFRNGTPAKMSPTITAAIGRKLAEGLRVLVFVSYDAVVGIVTEKAGETVLILDPTNYHRHGHQTLEQISLMRSAVNRVDDSLSAAVVNSRRKTFMRHAA